MRYIAYFDLRVGEEPTVPAGVAVTITKSPSASGRAILLTSNSYDDLLWAIKQTTGMSDTEADMHITEES